MAAPDVLVEPSKPSMRGVLHQVFFFVALAAGISLISQASGDAIAIPMKSVMVNKPSQIYFVVPANLPAGDYKLSLTTQYSPSGTKLKAGRTYLFDYILSVS